LDLQMEVPVHLINEYLLNPLLPESYHAPNFWPAQMFSCWLEACIGGLIFYFAFASLSYYFFFRWNRDNYYPTTLPEDLTEQIKVEIGIAIRSLPRMAVLFAPFTYGVTRGWSKMYYSVDEYGWLYLGSSVFMFLFLTDGMIYYIHRGLHHPSIYNAIHKLHHTYRYTTPFSSHAFHWVDGWAQGVPYYIVVYIFPLHSILWILMFIFVNFWTIFIHDQVDFAANSKVIMSTGHHTIHHTHFKFNFGQYFTFWDRINNTHFQGEATHDIFTGKRLKKVE